MKKEGIAALNKMEAGKTSYKNRIQIEILKSVIEFSVEKIVDL